MWRMNIMGSKKVDGRSPAFSATRQATDRKDIKLKGSQDADETEKKAIANLLARSGFAQPHHFNKDILPLLKNPLEEISEVTKLSDRPDHKLGLRRPEISSSALKLKEELTRSERWRRTNEHCSRVILKFLNSETQSKTNEQPVGVALKASAYELGEQSGSKKQTDEKGAAVNFETQFEAVKTLLRFGVWKPNLKDRTPDDKLTIKEFVTKMIEESDAAAQSLQKSHG